MGPKCQRILPERTESEVAEAGPFLRPDPVRLRSSLSLNAPFRSLIMELPVSIASLASCSPHNRWGSLAIESRISARALTPSRFSAAFLLGGNLDTAPTSATLRQQVRAA
jgi:hypothetical protein